MRLTRALVATLLTVAVASCGNSGSEQHNAADVAFVNEVIKQETTSAKLGELAASRGVDQKLRDLGAAMARSEHRDIDRATKMLTLWKATPPPVDADSAARSM